MPSLWKVMGGCFGGCFRSSDSKTTASQQLSPVNSKASITFDERPAWNGAVVKATEASGLSMDEPLDRQLLAAECQPHPTSARAAGRPPGGSRFQTLHRRRKKKPPTRALGSDNASLLDDLYNGPTQTLLERISEWPFNAFALDRATGGRPLPTLCFHLFHEYGLMAHFRLDPVKVWKFFSLVEEGYHSNNPYHNAIHAADVTQAMHCFLQEEKMRSKLAPLEIVSSLIAAMAHDLDHPGVNQPFLVATSNHLASLYKNASVLENHHWRSAIACLVESGMTDVLEAEASREMQRQIRSLILATDIARQQEFLVAFKDYLDNGTLDLERGADRHFMLQIALKCADISNPCRPWEVSRAWSLQVSEEFYRQGNLERRLGLPVTPTCDLYVSSVSKIQAGFFRFIAAPLFEEWHRFQDTPLSADMIDYLRSNQVKWDSYVDAEQTNRVDYSQPEEGCWLELGILETEMERLATRRASLPPGQSILCAAASGAVSAGSAAASADSRSLSNEQAEEDAPDPDVLLATESADASAPDALAPMTGSWSEGCGLAPILPGHVPHRRESLPFNFPGDRPSIRWTGHRLGRRESLPAKVYGDPFGLRVTCADDIHPDLSITSITPFHLPPAKKDKKVKNPQHPQIPAGSVAQRPQSIVSPSVDVHFACQDDKENVADTFEASVAARLTLRRGSAPTALHPLNWMDSGRCKWNTPLAPHLGRHNSLRLAKLDAANQGVGDAPCLRRRGSLPYELGRKLQANGEASARIRLQLDAAAGAKLNLRRGSAPCELLRNTSASIASCWIQFRDRVKIKGKELALSSGLMGDASGGFAVRERRRRSLRRRRSGGPELFASVIRRGNLPSAQLPPLPQSVTCTHAKVQRTSSLSSPDHVTASLIGCGDSSRDWLLLGRRGSGALELLAGLWRHRDAPERSSFDASDEHTHRLPRQRPSIDSSSSSDGVGSALDEFCQLAGYRIGQRRGSCPADNSSSLGSSSGHLEMNR